MTTITADLWDQHWHTIREAYLEDDVDVDTATQLTDSDMREMYGPRPEDTT